MQNTNLKVKSVLRNVLRATAETILAIATNIVAGFVTPSIHEKALPDGLSAFFMAGAC